VYVNKIAIRCADTITVKYLGENSYKIITSVPANIIFYMSLIIPVILTALIIVDGRIAFGIIPFTVIMISRELLVSSETLLKLLIRRISFLNSLLFGSVWLGITCYVLGGDARICAVFHGYFAYLTLVLQDANTTRPILTKYPIMRIISALRVGPILILSLFLLLDALPGTGHAVIALEGNNNGLSNYNSTDTDHYVGNDVQAIDLAQQAGDLGFFSLGLPIIVEAIWVIVRHQINVDRKNNNGIISDTLSTTDNTTTEDTFDTISSPIMPIFDEEQEIVISKEQLKNEVDDMVTKIVERGGERTTFVISNKGSSGSKNNNVGSSSIQGDNGVGGGMAEIEVTEIME
jgi:hypothetical protein